MSDGIFTLSDPEPADAIFAAVRLAQELPEYASELLRDPVAHEDEPS